MKKILAFILAVLTVVIMPMEIYAAAKLKKEWNESTSTLTLTIISNGEVKITVE